MTAVWFKKSGPKLICRALAAFEEARAVPSEPLRWRKRAFSEMLLTHME
jgi:hypothetical protein